MEIIKLNLIPSGVNPVCHCSQYDNGRVIRAELFDGLTPYSLASGDVVTLNVRKPDNTVVTGTITATQGNNYVDIITTEQICACVGNALCDLKITNGSTVIGTLNFIIQVERDVLADGVESQSQIRDLTRLAEEAVSSSIGDITSFRPYGIPPYMMSLFKQTDNLFSEFDNHITGAYYTGTPATVGNHLAIVTTPNWQGWLIRVKPNTTYTLGGCDFRLLFYNADLIITKAIQQADLSADSPNTITSDNDSYWLALTQRITRDMSEYMIVEGDTYPSSYISGYPQFVETPKLSDDNLSQIAIGYNATPINIAYGSDSATITIPTGVNIATTKGIIQVRTSAATELTLTANGNFISWDATASAWVLGAHIDGHELYVIGWVMRSTYKAVILANYTESGIPQTVSTRQWGYIYSTTLPKIKYIESGCTVSFPACRIIYAGGLINITATELTFTQPNWVCYDIDAQELRTGYAVSNHNLIMLGVIYPNRFESCYIAGVDLAIDKTIAIFGDSISAGSGTNKCYHQYIADIYGFTCLNYAYGGSGYVRSYQSYGAGLMGIGEEGRGVPITQENYFIPNNVLTRLQEVNPADLDGVVIFAGTNDWGNSVAFDDFIAGVDAVFDYYQTNFGDVPLLVMTPIHRKNDTIPKEATGKILMDYAEAIIQECKKYGIPYIDTMSMSGLHPDNAGNEAVFFPRDDRADHASDGLHPNHIAHERIMRAIGETLNGLVKYNNTAMR